MIKKKRKAYTEAAEDAEITEKREAEWRHLADLGYAEEFSVVSFQLLVSEGRNPRLRHRRVFSC